MHHQTSLILNPQVNRKFATRVMELMTVLEFVGDYVCLAIGGSIHALNGDYTLRWVVKQDKVYNV